MTKRQEIERLKELLADAHAEREEALAEIARLRRQSAVRRIIEPHVDRYFNGGTDRGYPPQVTAVVVEHTAPYRTNVVFGTLGAL